MRAEVPRPPQVVQGLFEKRFRGDAAAKGYNQTGLTGPNPMYAFVAETAGGPGHALGEIIYKTRRYAARRDSEDLVKIAAWAYLVWCFDRPAPDGRQQEDR